MLNLTNANYQSFANAVVPKLTHLPLQTLSSMYYDNVIGFKT